MIHDILIAILLAPLIGSAIAGLGGWKIGRVWSHRTTIGFVFLSFVLSSYVFALQVSGEMGKYNETFFTWMVADGLRFELGFLIDRLSSLMMVVVTFVSLMVHIYTIGYMDHDEDYDHDNPYYQRFFSYISLFTFSMLSLVMANNFLQLFFGWEAVGLVSYLLIGFYMKRESAIQANLKAFIVNRVGDFGFIIGIAMVAMYFNTLDYQEFFERLPTDIGMTVDWGFGQWDMITVLVLALFVGAMGKSAQMPLHVWLPESMEGPTPISALIHAATMVTAGIFMVARLSPAYELSEVALSVILFIGAITAFLMGLLGIVQNDIKRVVAYSTLSQLGYMTAALGASAYAAGMFHVMTHAFFKALLFLAAGSVIIAMHHRQDIRDMGGLRRYMPITYLAFLVGSLALIGFPGFSGFFSKDGILMAVQASTISGAGLAYALLLLGVFVTAFYSFRMFFIVFHGQESSYVQTHQIKESPWVVTAPLVLLAIPSALVGFSMSPMLFDGFLSDAIFVLPSHDVLAVVGQSVDSAWGLMLHSLVTAPFWLAIGGVFTAWLLFEHKPSWGQRIAFNLSSTRYVLNNAYGFDRFNEWFFVGGSKLVGYLSWKISDALVIDGALVNGSAKVTERLAYVMKTWQTGYLYHYAFVMIITLLGLLAWVLW